ncbi:MAG TPA: hypothetical protein VEA99_03635 [Gemmatimonadaceae bacterium]|nr:hypothetical protein [Gemmatimonadaceae bacterium]
MTTRHRASRCPGGQADERKLDPASGRMKHLAGWTRAEVTEVALRLLRHEIGLDVAPSQLHLPFVRDLGMG